MFLIRLVHSILDFFYPFLSKIFSKSTFYYAVCGVSNMLLGWFLFFIFYNFIFDKKLLYIEILQFTLSPYTLSAISCFFINFCVGFVLMKYIVFTESELKGRIQLFRYALSACISAFCSWMLLKVFVEDFHFFPSVANVVSTIIVVIISYLLQKKFSFK